MFLEFLKIYEYREMLKSSVKKDLRSRYKGSVLGFFWTFLNPLLTLLIYTVVFSKIMRVQVPGYSYSMFLFTGIVPWTFTSTAVIQSTGVILQNSNLIKKIYFPRILLPVSCVTTNFINMLLTFIVLFAALLFTKNYPSWLYVYLPVICILNFIFVLSLTMILSSATVYFRDLEHICSVFVMAWMYLTPIIYTSDFIPSKLFTPFKLNPMFYIVNSYRDIFMFNRVPDINGFMYVLTLSLGLLWLGYVIFYNLQKRFAEEI